MEMQPLPGLGHTPYDLDYYLKCRDAILSKLNIPLAGAE